jgi:hypothetical protein
MKKILMLLLLLAAALCSSDTAGADGLHAERLFEACRGADHGQWKRFAVRHRAYLIAASQAGLAARVSDEDLQYALPHLYDSPYYHALPRTVLPSGATPRQCAGNWLIFRAHSMRPHNPELRPNVFLRIIPDSVDPEAVYYLPVLHFTYIRNTPPRSGELFSGIPDGPPVLRNITVFGGDPHLSGTQAVQNQFVYLKHNNRTMVCNNYLYDSGIITAVARIKLDATGRNGSASLYDFFNQKRDSGIPLMRADFRNGRCETLYVYGDRPPWSGIESRDELYWPMRYPDEMQLLTRIREIIHPGENGKLFTTVFSDYTHNGIMSIPAQ